MYHYEFHKHAKLIPLGYECPALYRIDEGYERGEIRVTADRELALVKGVSSLKARKTSSGYKRRSNEEVYPLYGFVLKNKYDAERLGKFLLDVASKWDSIMKENESDV